MSSDNWADRSGKMKCTTCMWFVAKRVGGEGADVGLGRCRRHAPTMSGFPAVYASDWCGDHKLDETKVT